MPGQVGQGWGTANSTQFLPVGPRGTQAEPQRSPPSAPPGTILISLLFSPPNTITPLKPEIKRQKRTWQAAQIPPAGAAPLKTAAHELCWLAEHKRPLPKGLRFHFYKSHFAEKGTKRGLGGDLLAPAALNSLASCKVPRMPAQDKV